VLTGGASRRMGTDKALLRLRGIPLGEHVASQLALVCARVTVLGNVPIPGFEFLADTEVHEGPLGALSRFTPRDASVFVASCDLPWFEARLASALSERMEDADAVVPVLDGRRQPLCALYRASTFEKLAALVAGGNRRMSDWLDPLQVREVHDPDLDFLARGVNTPQEWAQVLSSDSG